MATVAPEADAEPRMHRRADAAPGLRAAAPAAVGKTTRVRETANRIDLPSLVAGSLRQATRKSSFVPPLARYRVNGDCSSIEAVPPDLVFMRIVHFLFVPILMVLVGTLLPTAALAAGEGAEGSGDAKPFTEADGSLLPAGVKVKGWVKFRPMDWQYIEGGKTDRFRTRYSGDLTVAYSGDHGGAKLMLELSIGPRDDRRSTTITMGDDFGKYDGSALQFREAFVALEFAQGLRVAAGAFLFDATNIYSKGLLWHSDRAAEGVYVSYVTGDEPKLTINALLVVLAENRSAEELTMLHGGARVDMMSGALTFGADLWTHINIKLLDSLYAAEDAEYIAVRLYAQYKLKDPKMRFWFVGVANLGADDNNLAMAAGVRYGDANRKEEGTWELRLFGHYAQYMSVVGELAADNWALATKNIGGGATGPTLGGSVGLFLNFRYILWKNVRARLDVIGSNPINAAGTDTHNLALRVRITFKFWFG
jgi:hypothetical protein